MLIRKGLMVLNLDRIILLAKLLLIYLVLSVLNELNCFNCGNVFILSSPIFFWPNKNTDLPLVAFYFIGAYNVRNKIS